MPVVQCLKCNSNFNKIPSEMRKTSNHFCSKSCANSYNNSKVAKRSLQIRYCKNCDEQLKRNSYKDRKTLCDDCFKSSSRYVDWSTITLEEVVGKRSYQKHSRIRELARRNYIKSGRPMSCKVCDYNYHVDICHIKAIKDHKPSDLVSDINHQSNLIALCKNHHWEFDRGLLILKEDELP